MGAGAPSLDSVHISINAPPVSLHGPTRAPSHLHQLQLLLPVVAARDLQAFGRASAMQVSLTQSSSRGKGPHESRLCAERICDCVRLVTEDRHRLWAVKNTKNSLGVRNARGEAMRAASKRSRQGSRETQMRPTCSSARFLRGGHLGVSWGLPGRRVRPTPAAGRRRARGEVEGWAGLRVAGTCTGSEEQRPDARGARRCRR